MKIKSFVSGHPIVIYRDAVFDPSIRRYRGGVPVITISAAGRMLSARSCPQKELSSLWVEGEEIPLRSAPEWESADPIPSPDECDYAVVSAMYVTACKALGWDTSRLLTVGGTVVDESGKVIGAAWLNRN